MAFTKIRSRVKNRLHRHKRDGQSTDADDTASIMSDDSLTMTVVMRCFAELIVHTSWAANCADGTISSL